MLRLQELQRAGVNSYDTAIKYYKQYGLVLRFETKHANILVQERATAGVTDCLLYVCVAGTESSFPGLAEEASRSKHVVYAVNKM